MMCIDPPSLDVHRPLPHVSWRTHVRSSVSLLSKKKKERRVQSKERKERERRVQCKKRKERGAEQEKKEKTRRVQSKKKEKASCRVSKEKRERGECRIRKGKSERGESQSKTKTRARCRVRKRGECPALVVIVASVSDSTCNKAFSNADENEIHDLNTQKDEQKGSNECRVRKGKSERGECRVRQRQERGAENDN